MSTRIPDTAYIWRRFTEINLVIEIRLLKVERERGEKVRKPFLRRESNPGRSGESAES